MDADERHVIRFGGLTGMNLEIDEQFQRAVMLFTHSLKSTGEGNSESLMDELLCQLEKYNRKSLWRFYAFHLANALVELIQDNKSARFRMGKEYPKITALLKMALSTASAVEYARLIREITALLMEASKEWDAQQQAKSRESLHSWLEKHLLDPRLSLEMIAGEFGFSTTYWSRYFSEQLGISFNDMVWRRRCDLFQQRLLATDTSIKDLVLEVGYIDVSSFSRRFKQEIGMTPGQYRQHQHA